MSLLIDSCVDNPTLPEIPNSLRFNSASSHTLSHVNTATGNQKTWVMSMWVKRSTVATSCGLFGVGNAVSGVTCSFHADGRLMLTYQGVGNQYTTALFRDVTDHYHIVIAFDTSQATAAERCKLYVNSVYYAFGSNLFGLNYNSLNTASGTTVYIGLDGWASYYANGYISYVTQIDGYPSGVNNANWASTNFGTKFAYTDYNGKYRTLSKPELTALVNSGGTNSFFLDFENGSNTTTLGYDASSKGNNWTLNSMVRSVGPSDCWMIDTPTNNFPTLSSVDNYSMGISEGALTTLSPYGDFAVRCTQAIPDNGKYYWEVANATAWGTANAQDTGIMTGNALITSPSTLRSAGKFCGFAYTGPGGTAYVRINSTNVATTSTVITGSDIFQFAYDTVNNKLWLGRNNVWYDSVGTTTGNPSEGTNHTGSPSLTFAPYFPGIAMGDQVTSYFNFGQGNITGSVFDPVSGGRFKYAPPTGFKALCTKNIDATQGLITSGTFTGNAAADGPFVWTNGVPSSLTIDGNAVTWGTHADKLANGFKIRTASTPYNDAASNAFSVTVSGNKFKYANAQTN